MPTCTQIIDLLKPIEFSGNKQANVTEILQLENDLMHRESLVWCADKNKETLLSIKEGTVMLSKESFDWINSQNKSVDINWIVVQNPRRAFLNTVKAFFYHQEQNNWIHPSAQIHVSVTIDRESASIGHNNVIEKNCIIGKNVRIGHNNVILSNTIIGDHVTIGNNNTIGGIGFGYEKNEDGEYELIPHIGNVVIENAVEIGNNTTIDRAVLGSTRIGTNVKIDNLVHIAHGVQIGENSLIIANCMIAGSVKIGKNVWIGPSTSIIQNIKIGDDALIGLASNVLKEVDAGAVMVGNPAKKIR